MLRLINTRFFIFGLLILLVFLPSLTDYYLIYIINIVALFAYYNIITSALNKPDSYYTKQRLGVIIFFYSLFFVSLNKIISYYYQGNFFVFSEADAMKYHTGGLELASKPFIEGIYYAAETWGTMKISIGPFIIVGLLYRIVETTLILNLLYVFLGIITARSVFSICKIFISVRYSFLCALIYSTSSYVIWFHSSGLKESLMVMLIVVFYDYYYQYFKSRKIKYLLFAILFLLAISLFRPALMFFCIASIGIGILLMKERKKRVYFFVIGLLTLGIFFSSTYIDDIAKKYVAGEMDDLIEGRELDGMIKGSLTFTYAVNTIATVMGPLPTVLPNSKQILSIFSIGLIYRVFIALAFWLGVFYCVKNKVVLMYPIMLFMFMEMISLTVILEALELRKSLPHFPFIYIISFWFLDYYDKKAISSKIERSRIRNLWNVSSVLFLVLIIYWNYR